MDILRHLLLENPLTPCIVLGLIAVVAGFFWSRTASRRALGVVLACCLATAVIVTVSWLVETDRERVVAALQRMSAAATRCDAEAFIGEISPEYDPAAGGKAGISTVVRSGLRILRAHGEEPAIRMEDGRATVTQVYHFSPAPNSRLVVPREYEAITWEGAFAPDADGRWRLRSVVATRPERMSPQDAARGLIKLAAQLPNMP
jgi:hypothetical protein